MPRISMAMLSCFLLLVGLAAPTRSGAAGKGFQVIVAAGAWDRLETVVSFALPQEQSARLYRLRDETGQTLPLQVDGQRRAWFVLPDLQSGATRTYQMEAVGADSPKTGGIEVTREKDGLQIATLGRPVVRYQAEKSGLSRQDIKPLLQRGGYLHPIFTPSGRIVSDDYPSNHLHHHGVWAAWTKTEFEGRHPDFWNMGGGTGTVEFQAVEEFWSGPVQGGLRARHRYVDLSAPMPRTVLNEIWEILVYRSGEGKQPHRMFDLATRQECATDQPLVLPEYHYGGVGFRGHRQWDGKDNTMFLTSEGKDRTNGHATRARWCHIGGQVDGELAGLAVLCHPDNFRAPQPMRIHPTEPFFNFAPSQLGRWEIKPGQPYVSRYRFIAHDGPPSRALLERLWNDYAQPPEVRVRLQ